jgi:tetratricopeptide (TPR) repeat protein
MREHLNAVLGDRYTVDRELGRGGMASVWLAMDVRHDRAVAIKVLHPELAGAIGVDRFVREVRLTAKLQHPNIVPLLDSGVFQGSDGTTLPWYAMAYVAGESLRARLDRERQLPIEEALRITEAAASALQAAHRVGIVHRDIKPENLLLSGEQVYVADFGIAKALIDTGSERLTSTGTSLGTPAYMSPEQATGDVVDARSDQYSLATVLYEMLAGEPPFTGPTTQAIVGRRLAEPARAIRPVRSAVPTGVEAALLKALERVPADRFPDVGAFVAALRSGLASPHAPDRRAGRRRRVATAAASVVLLGGIAAGGSVMLHRARGSPVVRDSITVALYERGMQSSAQRTPEAASDAIRSLRAAVERDSMYAEAWAALAHAYAQAHIRRFVFPGALSDSVLRLAIAASDRALALQPNSAATWVTQAEVARQLDPTDVAPGIRANRRAIAIDSAYAPAWRLLGLMLFDSGARNEGIRDMRRSVAADPSYVEGLAFLALGYYWKRQYDSASYWIDSAMAVNPKYLLGRHTAGLIAIEQGRFPRATAALDAALRLSTEVEKPNALAASAIAAARAGRKADAKQYAARAESLNLAYVPIPSHNALYMSQAYAAIGDGDRAIAWLKRYPQSADVHFQMHLDCDPPFDPLEDDPRFRALLLEPRPGKTRGC